MKKIFPIQWMHCKSCEMLIESACKDIPDIVYAKASSAKSTLEIDAKNISQQLGKTIEDAVEKLGYHMGEKNTTPFFSSDSIQRIISLLTIVFIVIVMLIARDQWWSTQNLSATLGKWNLLFYPLLIWLVAGISTCMALVGGVISSISAKWNEQHQNLSSRQRFFPQLYFQGGRILGFIVLGGFLGMLGNVFLFDGRVMGIASILVGILMLILGLDLTKLFPRIRTVSARLPFMKSSHPRWGAFLAGVLTFFLPCGFTLAMQILAISSGNFWMGGLIMGSFALGTLPGLLGIGGLLARAKGQWGKILFSIVGILTLFFGGYTINQGITLVGYNGSREANTWTETITKTMTYTADGLQPQELILEKGNHYQIDIIPETTVQWCMSTILLPGLDSHISMVKKGEPIHFTFTADKVGTYEFVCAMGVSHLAKIIIQ